MKASFVGFLLYISFTFVGNAAESNSPTEETVLTFKSTLSNVIGNSEFKSIEFDKKISLNLFGKLDLSPLNDKEENGLGKLKLKSQVFFNSLVKVLDGNLLIMDSLNLDKCKVSDTEMETLSLALKGNKTLDKLSLGENKITMKGIKALAEFIACDTPLTSLGLKNYSSLPTSVTYTNINIAYEDKQKMQEIKLLSEAIQKNSKLKDLDLSWNNFKNPGANCLSEGAFFYNNSLVNVDLRFNNIGDEGCAALVGVVCNNYSFKDKGKNYSLKSLNLSNNSISFAFSKDIKKSFQTDFPEMKIKLNQQLIGQMLIISGE